MASLPTTYTRAVDSALWQDQSSVPLSSSPTAPPYIPPYGSADQCGGPLPPLRQAQPLRRLLQHTIYTFLTSDPSFIDLHWWNEISCYWVILWTVVKHHHRSPNHQQVLFFFLSLWWFFFLCLVFFMFMGGCFGCFCCGGFCWFWETEENYREGGLKTDVNVW